MKPVDRLTELRDKFDRLTRAAMEHGYSNDLKRQLATLADDIKKEEIAQRFIGREVNREKSVETVVR